MNTGTCTKKTHPGESCEGLGPIQPLRGVLGQDGPDYGDFCVFNAMEIVQMLAYAVKHNGFRHGLVLEILQGALDTGGWLDEAADAPCEMCGR